MATAAVRKIELDGIRGLAALMVVLCHLPIHFSFGETGVDLFFVLSGYLITGIILVNRTGPRFFSTFFTRRTLRIWPIYYIALAAVLGVNLLRRHPEPMQSWPWYLFYLQETWGYFGRQWGNISNLGHTWTLAIEEQFYLIWPVVLYLFQSRNAFRVMILAGVVVPFWLRWNGLSSHMLFTHTDSLMLGALLAAYELSTPDRSRTRDVTIFLTVAVMSIAAYLVGLSLVHAQGGTTKEYVETGSRVAFMSLCYFGIVGAVTNSIGHPATALLRNPVLAYLGRISYGLYLYHWIIFENLDTYFKFRLGGTDTVTLSVMKVAASLAVAAFSWKFIEQPILAFKNRLAYSRRESGARAAAVMTGS